MLQFVGSQRSVSMRPEQRLAGGISTTVVEDEDDASVVDRGVWCACQTMHPRETRKESAAMDDGASKEPLASLWLPFHDQSWQKGL